MPYVRRWYRPRRPSRIRLEHRSLIARAQRLLEPKLVGRIAAQRDRDVEADVHCALGEHAFERGLIERTEAARDLQGSDAIAGGLVDQAFQALITLVGGERRYIARHQADSALFQLARGLAGVVAFNAPGLRVGSAAIHLGEREGGGVRESICPSRSQMNTGRSGNAPSRYFRCGR